MTDITYGIVEAQYCLNKTKRIKYGVVAYCDGDAENDVIVIASIHDVTSEKNKLLELINKCNNCKLSLIHLDDVIQDFLAD